MKNTTSEKTTVEYPTTRTFEGLFEELVNWSEQILDIADRRKKYPRDHDEYYQAMADLHAIVVILPILGQDLDQEMKHLDDLFPEDDDEDDE